MATTPVIDRRRLTKDIRAYNKDAALGPATIKRPLMDAVADKDRAATVYRHYCGKASDPESGELWIKTSQPPKIAPEDMPTLERGQSLQWVSTRERDRDGEVIMPGGVMLDEFKSTGMPVLWGHRYDVAPIGRDKWIRPYPKKSPYGILALSEYDTDDEFAGAVYGKKQRGFLTTHSVGFMPVEVKTPGAEGWDQFVTSMVKTYGEDYAETLGTVSAAITRWVLWEHSDVSVPSNAQAMTVAVSKGELEINDRERRLYGLPAAPMPLVKRLVFPIRRVCERMEQIA